MAPMPERRHKQYAGWIPDELLEKIFQKVEDRAESRNSMSQVCKQWYAIDCLTRRRLVVSFSYAVSPAAVSSRFQNLRSLKIKGEPRVSEFGILGTRWGGYAGPWIDELVMAKSLNRAFTCLSSLHLLRMKVFDTDLSNLAQGLNSSLEVLKLQKCSGFSRAGLLSVARSCRSLRVFDLEESLVEEAQADICAAEDWLHELALHNTQLEVLSFFLTGIRVRDVSDIVTILTRCKSLGRLKMSEINATNLSRESLCVSDSLRELGIFYDQNSIEHQLQLPGRITSFAGDLELPIDEQFGFNLVELDLMSTCLDMDAESHGEVISSCPNLEVLKVRNLIGDPGLEAVAQHCKKLKSIRIENLVDQHGFVSHHGLMVLARNCIHLEKVAVYVSDIANCALEAFARFCPSLVDFRLVLLDTSPTVTELPLDNGVRSILQGCQRMEKLAIYLRYGGLTDEGLAHIGRLGNRLKWILLGYVGNSDVGLLQLANGCQSLVKLEVRGSHFTAAGLAAAVRCMRSLRYLWVQGLQSGDWTRFLEIGEYWRVEYIRGEPKESQIVAYRSVAPHRMDYPPEVVPLSNITKSWEPARLGLFAR